MNQLETIGAEVAAYYHEHTRGGLLELLPWWLWIVAVVVVVSLVASWFTGRRRGSHAGRENVRRAYRRELARQMARDDAKKILAGEDPAATKRRRRWMQW